MPDKDPMLFHDKHTQKTRNGRNFNLEKGHILKHQTYR